MAAIKRYKAAPPGPWDEEHVKVLLRFPRFPIRLIQQEPWQTWLNARGGLAATYKYLQNYPLSPSHRRLLEVVLSNPEAISDVYATHLNVSRATYFYQLRELVPVLVQALNHWAIEEPAGEVVVPEAAALLLSNLPTPLTSLVGMEPSLETLVPVFLSHEVRLLTLLGPGGIGKTRLGIELAKRLYDRFPDGVCFVDLTTLQDSQFVASVIGHALGLKEVSQSQSEAQLKTYLRDKALLLVLDNFEHLMPVAMLVTDLLAAAPRLKILITSRVALHVYGEYEFTVSPLALPSLETLQEPTQLAPSPAVTLFVQRAQAVDSSFSLSPQNFKAVAELCVQVDGIPLAIELAAAQIKYFSPQALLMRISNSKRLLFLSHGLRNLLPRQQTLRGMLDWSYLLLTPELQTLFSRLSVFAGGCTIESVAEVCPTAKLAEDAPLPDIPYPAEVGLTALVDHSLLQQQVEPSGEPRFHMLGITREYALERAGLRGELPQLQRAHTFYYLNLVEQIDRQTDEYLQPSQVEALRREHVNHQAAIQWALDNQAGEVGLRFIAALWDFWNRSEHQQDGRQLTQVALEQTTGVRTSVRARVQRLVGWLAHDLRDYTTMLHSFQAGLEISEALDDRRGVGLAWHGLAQLAQLRGQWDQARAYLDQCVSLFQDLGDQKQLAWSKGFLGCTALGQADLTTAQAHLADCLHVFQTLGSNRGAIFALGHLGQTHLYQGSLPEAAARFEECYTLCNSTDDTRSPMAALALNYLGEIALYQNQLLRARELISASLTLSKDEGFLGHNELSSYTFGLLAMKEGWHLSAAQCFRESLLLQQLLKEHWRSLMLLEAVAALLVARQELLGAARLYGAANHLRTAIGIPRLPLYRLSHEQNQQQIERQLDAHTLEEAQAAGRSLSLDQAVTYALRCVE